MTTEKFDLSKEILCANSVIYGNPNTMELLTAVSVKKFIRRQIDRIDNRILYLEDFDGITEAMLQMAELKKVKDDLLKDAGEKLI